MSQPSHADFILEGVWIPGVGSDQDGDRYVCSYIVQHIVISANDDDRDVGKVKLEIRVRAHLE